MRFIIITGLSGAGKTQVIRCLEDLDYYCIDNMPPALIPKFAEICYSSNGKINKVAKLIHFASLTKRTAPCVNSCHRVC